LILGNVTEGTQVAAYGDINIMGNVSGAVIQAGGRVVCQGKIIGSRVRAGGLKAFYNRLAPLLDDLDRILNEIARETSRIQQHPGYHDRLKKDDIDKIVMVLVERKRQKIKALADRYAAALEGVDLPFPPVISELALGIRNFFTGPVNREAPRHEDLEGIVRKKEDISHLLDSLLDQSGDILCAYIQNSVLDAGGNIIAGEDCYQSTLTAGKGVRVGGVFRGGEIFALGNVIIAESGSSGLSTGVAHIRVAEGASISLRKAYPGTTVKVGNRSFDFNEVGNHVKIYSDSKGKLKIETSGD